MEFVSQTTEEVNHGDTVVETFETEAGKEIQIVRERSTILLKIRFGSGGELPIEFRGSFTNIGSARASVDTYLNRKRLESVGIDNATIEDLSILSKSAHQVGLELAAKATKELKDRAEKKVA